MRKVSKELVLAARKELKRRAARISLANFVTYTYPEYQLGWFHSEVCQALDEFLQDIVEKKSPRLIICAPPRSGKSELVSRRFPAYVLGRYPDLSFIGTSYSSDLAGSFSKDVQRIMEEPSFHEVFPDVYIPAKGIPSKGAVRQADRFDIIDYKGSYYTVGVGGSLTGRGANCIVEGEKVLTPSGYASIDSISPGQSVMSYNHQVGRLEVDVIDAVRQRYVKDEIIQIDSDGGRSLRVTPEHPIYTNGRYKEANLLAKGEVLLCALRQGDCSSWLRMAEVGEEREKKSLLFSQMCPGCRVRAREKYAPMPKVWCINKERQQVLSEVCQRSIQVATWAGETSFSNGYLRDLRERVSIKVAKRKDRVRPILLSELRRYWTQPRDDGRQKHSLQRRSGQKALFGTCSNRVQVFETVGSGKGSTALRSLRSYGKSSRTSRRFGFHKQLLKQCGHALQGLSSTSPQARGTKDIRNEYVAKVEKIPLNGRKVKVYDLQVRKNHNFFANGILVHNCLVIDDPVSNMQDALSERVRDSTWDWYTSTAYTRLAPGGGLIVMCTRWHMDDLIGRLLTAQDLGEGDNWKVINFPAIAEFDEQYRKAGEALHPERFNLDALLKIRKSVGERVWAALYQQHPVPDGGGLFKADWIQHWTPETLPEHFDAMVMSWDMTFKETNVSDFVVGQVWGREGANFYLLDQVRARMDFVKTLDAFVKLVEKWPNFRRRLVEDKANGPAIISALKDKITGIIPITPKESKEARAASVTTLWEAGNVWLPPVDTHPWVKREFIPELLSFPAGAHDDQVDACTQALSDLHLHTGWKVSKSNMAALRARRF